MAITTESIDYVAASSHGLGMSDENFGALDLTTFSFYCRFKLSSDGSAIRPIFRQQAIGGGALSFAISLDASDRIDIFMSDNGATQEGRLVTNATFTSTTEWVSVLYHWDQTNGTAGDRMKLWVGVGGAEMTEVTSFATDVTPTDDMFDAISAWRWGYNGANTLNFDGKIYDGAFFDGVLVPHTDLEDKGVSKDIESISGLHSHLNVDGGTVNNDGVLSTNWTSVNSVSASNDVPGYRLAESDGVATVASVGVTAVMTVGSSTGTSTSSAVGDTGVGITYGSIGTSTGTSTSSGISGSVGDTNGIAMVSGVGASIVKGVGSADGVSTESGVGSANSEGVGFASGVASLSGVGTISYEAVGLSTGMAAASGTGESLSAGVSSISGVGSAVGVGAANYDSVGLSEGIATVMAIQESTGIISIDELELSIQTRLLSNSISSSIVEGLRLTTTIL